MQYDVGQDPYIDKATGIFHNKLGIVSQSVLDTAEFRITAVKIAILEEHLIGGNFDLSHLCAIHEYIFGELYEWAGKIRTIEMQKDSTEFAKVNAILPYSQTLFSELREDNYLIDLPRNEYLVKFAHYYSEVNILHPFREGNGRALRAFMQALARRAGYVLDWQYLDGAENVAACIAAYHGDNAKLIAMLDPMLEFWDKAIWGQGLS